MGVDHHLDRKPISHLPVSLNRTSGLITFTLVRFRKKKSIMADEEAAEVYEEEQVEEVVEEEPGVVEEEPEEEPEPEPEPEPVKEPTPPPAPKKKAPAKKAAAPVEEPEEEATGLAKYAPSGEVDQYGFPVIPKGKRTPIKVLGSKLSNILRYKEDSQKSKEQWDIEKQNSSWSRIVPFGIEGLDYDALCERAKALHQVIWNLEANCYDYQQKFERQNYDMMELAERARQMNRGRRKTPTGHTGLGGSVHPWIQDRYKGSPPKISLFSKYERQKDRRTFGERRLIYQDPEDAKAKGLRVEKPIPLPVN